MTLSNLSRRRFVAGLLGLSSGFGLTACQRRPNGPSSPPPLTGSSATIVRKGAGDYELWRRSMPWQLVKPDRYPEMIVRPNTVTEVVDALKLARSEGLQVTARSGGHHVWGSVLRDGGMLVDMSRFRDVVIDDARGIAEVGPSVWSDALARSLATRRYAFPVAHCATVPMGGYLMSGGLGINGDEWGPLACFSVVGADIVTADGELATASAEENEDLFWAVRGAGNGFFGIVTRYRLKVYPLPAAVRVSVYVYPATRLVEIGEWLRSLAAEGLPKTELLCLLLDNPDASPTESPEARKLCVVRPAVFADSQEEAERILRPLASHPLAREAAFASGLQETTIEHLLQESIDIKSGLGFGRYAVDTLWTESPPEAMRTVVDEFMAAPSWKTHVVLTFKSQTDLPEDAALSRLTDTWIGSYAVWDRAIDDAANVGWLRATSAAMQPYAVAHSINEIDAAADPGKIRRSFSEAAWARLREVRAQRDPDGLFNDFLHLE